MSNTVPLKFGLTAHYVLRPKATALRCGRRTISGAPCRTPVTFVGDACQWHRTEARR
jgi:hypothetical protein